MDFPPSTSHVPAGYLQPSFFPFFLPTFRLEECKIAARTASQHITNRKAPTTPETLFVLAKPKSALPTQSGKLAKLCTFGFRWPVLGSVKRAERLA
jgi:hypothetical protein